MKNLMKGCVLSVAMLVLMCGIAGAADFNAQGSVLIPNLMYYYLDSNNWTRPYITLTNISCKTVQCRLKIYAAEGDELTKYAHVATEGGRAWTTISLGTSDFEIPAHCTRLYYLDRPSYVVRTIGYGILEWKSDDPLLRKALIGGVSPHRHDGDSRYSIASELINNGHPF